VLFNEPKLLKLLAPRPATSICTCFSALQRAEIAEILSPRSADCGWSSFSALQRAEIAEIDRRGRAVLAGTPKFQCSSTSRNC